MSSLEFGFTKNPILAFKPLSWILLRLFSKRATTLLFERAFRSLKYCNSVTKLKFLLNSTPALTPAFILVEDLF
ncbi:hypothetical protein AVBRAN12642_09520 [Campylobacter sp. RM12642]|uniref:hypothetical protein n=1 Tax=Campylobacter sp. RM12642 TaxID=2735736 RepID=UPI0030153A21|nr:hypothetical protein [Campylobacter sp. RM12642]